MSTAPKRNQFIVSLAIRVLYERIRLAAIGDVIPYKELSALINLDVQSERGRKKLDAARRRAERDNKMLFRAVTNQGIQRLDDIGITESGPATVRRIRSTARRGVKRLTLVRDFASLPNAAKIAHNTSAAQLGALHEFTKPAATKRIEDEVKATNHALPLAETLAVFRGGK